MPCPLRCWPPTLLAAVVAIVELAAVIVIVAAIAGSYCSVVRLILMISLVYSQLTGLVVSL